MNLARRAQGCFERLGGFATSFAKVQVQELRGTRSMEPLVVLVVVPIVVGLATELAFRDTTRASLAATILSSAAVYACIESLDPGGTWNALAGFLVSPVAIAFSVATVLTLFGMLQGRRLHRRHRA